MRQSFSSRLARSGVVIVLGGVFAAACGGIVGPLDEGGSIGDTLANNGDDGGSHSGGGRGNGGNGNGGGMTGGGSGGGYGDDDDDAGSYGDDDGGYAGDDDDFDGGVILVDAAPPTADSGTHAGDAGPSDAGIQDAGAADVSGSAVLGSIVVSPYPFQGKGRPPGNIQASFYTEVPAAPATCTVSTVGACVLHRCPAGGTVPMPTHVSSTAEAGTITANVSGTMDTLTYSTATSSYSIGTFFNAGYDGKISVSAAGVAGSVPAFSMTILEPAEVAITSPAETLVTKSPPSGAPAVYSTSFARLSNLPVAWTGGVAGTELVLTLTVAATNGMAGYDSLECTFDQGDGADIIPSAGGLALLPPVDGKTTLGTIALHYKSSATAASGPVTITLSETATNRNIVTFTTTN